MGSRAALTCPSCGLVQDAEMPDNACQYFYECTGCHALLRPLAGDCCVFCSYGDRRCPPKERSQAASRHADESA